MRPTAPVTIVSTKSAHDCPITDYSARQVKTTRIKVAKKYHHIVPKIPKVTSDGKDSIRISRKETGRSMRNKGNHDHEPEVALTWTTRHRTRCDTGSTSRGNVGRSSGGKRMSGTVNDLLDKLPGEVPVNPRNSPASIPNGRMAHLSSPDE